MLWLLLPALASDLVLHRDQDVRVAVAARMAAESGASLDTLVFRSLSGWGRSVGPRFTGGQAVGCADEVRTPVRLLTERVEGARARVISLDFGGADDLLYRFERDLVCADGVLPQRTLADGFFVRGALAAVRGETEAAEAAFRDARSMDPDRSFDPTLAPVARPAFERARPPVPSAWVRVVPAPDQVWVDGERVTYSDRGMLVAPGRHLIAVQGGSLAVVDVQVEGDGVLTVPSALGDELFGRLADPQLQGELSQVLAGVDQPAAWFTDLATIWRAENGHFTPVFGVQPPPPPKRAPLTPLGIGIGAAGLVSAAVGVALLAGGGDAELPGIAAVAGGGALAATGVGLVVADRLHGPPGLGLRVRW